MILELINNYKEVFDILVVPFIASFLLLLAGGRKGDIIVTFLSLVIMFGIFSIYGKGIADYILRIEEISQIGSVKEFLRNNIFYVLLFAVTFLGGVFRVLPSEMFQFYIFFTMISFGFFCGIIPALLMIPAYGGWIYGGLEYDAVSKIANTNKL